MDRTIPRELALILLVTTWVVIGAAFIFWENRKREREAKQQVEQEPKEAGLITRHVIVDRDNDEVSAEAHGDCVVLKMTRELKKSKMLELAVRLDLDEAETFAKTILKMVETSQAEESTADKP